MGCGDGSICFFLFPFWGLGRRAVQCCAANGQPAIDNSRVEIPQNLLIGRERMIIHQNLVTPQNLEEAAPGDYVAKSEQLEEYQEMSVHIQTNHLWATLKEALPPPL